MDFLYHVPLDTGRYIHYHCSTSLRYDTLLRPVYHTHPVYYHLTWMHLPHGYIPLF